MELNQLQAMLNQKAEQKLVKELDDIFRAIWDRSPQDVTIPIKNLQHWVVCIDGKSIQGEFIKVSVVAFLSHIKSALFERWIKQYEKKEVDDFLREHERMLEELEELQSAVSRS